MSRKWGVYVVLMITLASCKSQPAQPEITSSPPLQVSPEAEIVVSPTISPATAATNEIQPTLPTSYDGFPLTVAKDNLFSGSGNCVSCHTQMVDAAGKDVSFGKTWRSSMMANAARDPYWQASVRSEVIQNPDYQATIEAKCATCHMPMALYSTRNAGQEASVLDQGFSNPDHELYSLAMDGVSCTVCHQIQADNLTTNESYSGGYLIDLQKPMGERAIYGPFNPPPGLVTVMSGVSGYVPRQGLHIQSSEICATCHVLYTPYVDENGQIAGEFPEQMVYFEWKNSAFAEKQSCQSCHMPEVNGSVQLSVTGGPQRTPVSQHIFSGGNAYMAAMLQMAGGEIEVTASSNLFAESINYAADMLENQTAELQLLDLQVNGNTLLGQVSIQTSVGHKFPSSFPSRRAWLHIRVLDSGGQVVFESGNPLPDGSIQGNDNDLDPGLYEPHYTRITSEDQVQIYETIMADTLGNVTTTLLRAAAYLKDNRLLPQGFDLSQAGSDIAVYGGAVDDSDFSPGGDVLELAIDLDTARGPFQVTVELLFQPIGYRWAMNLKSSQGEEIVRFTRYFETLEFQPIIVSSDQMEVGK